MKRTRFTEKQIIGVLKEVEAGGAGPTVTVYLKRRSTTGSRNMADWRYLMPAAKRSGITLRWEGRCTMVMLRALTVASAVNCATRRCSYASRMPLSSLLPGCRTTTGKCRTYPLATKHRRHMPPNWVRNVLLRYALRAPPHSPLLQPR